MLSRPIRGPLLGPLLFLMYINSVTEVCLSLATKLTLYADDMLVYKPVHSESCYPHLQRDINNIFQWSQDNLMTFKCNVYVADKHLPSNTKQPPSGTCSINEVPGFDCFTQSFLVTAHSGYLQES